MQISKKLGGIAQPKDLFKHSVIGMSTALPLTCSKSGATDRKKREKRILSKEKSAPMRKGQQHCKKPEGKEVGSHGT